MAEARCDPLYSMVPKCDPFFPANAHWALGDWFEGVLSHLAPADVAACRLVSRAWRAQTRAALRHLSLSRQAGSAAVAAAAAAAFPHLRSLHVRLGGGGGAGGSSFISRTSSSGSSGRGGGPRSPQAPPLVNPAPALHHYCKLALRQLVLEAPGARMPTCELCPLSMRALGALRHLAALSLTGFEVCCDGDGWWQLSGLGALELVDCSMREGEAAAAVAEVGEAAAAAGRAGEEGQQQLQQRGGVPAVPPGAAAAAAATRAAGTLMQALQPLTRLVRLVLRGRVEWYGGEGALVLAGVSALGMLRELVVDGDFCLPPEVWEEVVALPQLTRLTFCRSPWAGHEFDELALTDRSLGQLADAAPVLQALGLGGHALLTDAGLAHICKLKELRALDLRLGYPGLAPGSVEGQGVTDQGLQQLSRLGALRSLDLSNCPLREGAWAAVARMTALTRLLLRSCQALDDEAMFRLGTLRGLQDLALVDCPQATDIGISFLMRHTTRLTSLDLSGSDRNLTDMGLASVARAGGLRRLSLAHCQRVSEAGLAALLLRLEGLTHLSLRDCCGLTDETCALLAAYTPQLESLDLEYCEGIRDQGIAMLSGLRLLQHVRVHEAGATPGAVLSLVASKSGRRLRIDSSKPCWWTANEG